MLEHLFAPFIQRGAVVRDIAQRQRTVAAQIDVPDLNIRFKVAQVVLRRQAESGSPDILPRYESLKSPG